MNDLYFVKYKPQIMMLDTIGLSPLAQLAHRRLFDMTIIDDSPPANEDYVLSQKAGLSPKEWAKVKPELVKKGWRVSEDGAFFLHGGTVECLNQSKVDYVTQFNRTAKANGKPYLGLSDADPVTGCLTMYVTSTSRSRDAVRHGACDVPQLELESELELESVKTSTKLQGARAKSRFSVNQTETVARFDKSLAETWENDRSKWLKRIQHDVEKCIRVVSEIESAVKESRIKTTPAQYAEQLWKEFA